MGALLVAYVAMRWRAATINPIAACEAAEQQVSHLHQSWMNTPLAAAEALRQMWEAEMLDPGAEQHILHVSSDARRCCAISDERCDGLRRSVAPFALFLASLRQSVELPRRAHLRRKGPNAQAPRVVVVGGGPAGLSATLLAHRAGADVTVIERRTHYTRPVWFDMQPPPAMEEEGEEEWKEDTSAQTLLRAWGFFALEPRVVIDPSGVMTVQCRVLEAFLALAASLLHVNLLPGETFTVPCIDGSGEFTAALASAKGVHDSTRRPPSSASGSGSGAADAAGRSSASLPPGSSAAPLDVPLCEHESPLWPRFDLLIGADGATSRVRDAVEILSRPQAQLSTAGGRVRVHAAEPFSQVTLVLALEMDAEGRCPQPRRDLGTGAEVPPYAVSFAEPGVSTCFKRLFEPYCEVQLLFENELGEALLTQFERSRPKRPTRAAGPAADTPDAPVALEEEKATASTVGATLEEDETSARALPLPLLRRVLNRVLATNYATDADVLRALRRQPAASAAAPQPPDAALFKIVIHKADVPGRMLRSSTAAGGASALALLRGDAVVNAHYRLGIGINQAFGTLGTLDGLLRAIWSHGGRSALLDQKVAGALLRGWNEPMEAAAADMVQSQLTIMHLEADCGLLVLDWQAYRRQRANGTLTEVPIDELARLDCSRHGRNAYVPGVPPRSTHPNLA
jgi:hypothetical protein